MSTNCVPRSDGSPRTSYVLSPSCCVLDNGTAYNPLPSARPHPLCREAKTFTKRLIFKSGLPTLNNVSRRRNAASHILTSTSYLAVTLKLECGQWRPPSSRRAPWCWCTHVIRQVIAHFHLRIELGSPVTTYKYRARGNAEKSRRCVTCVIKN